MRLIYSDAFLKQVSKLDKPIQKRIFNYMDKVAQLENPRSRGKGLVSNLSGLWRYRVGDYRILCRIKDAELIITVVEVGHRREIYD
ncbi:MAG: type II toxin-antitoxin system RelE/ParE family toxin [Prevotella sp.]|nr:type II toxin-antitoxin system RelE/ParE family toxin [Prevotella sp.]